MTMKVAEVRLSPVHPTRKAVITDEGMETCPYGIRMPDGWVVAWDYVVEFKPIVEKEKPVERPARKPVERTRKPRKEGGTRRGRKKTGEAPES